MGRKLPSEKGEHPGQELWPHRTGYQQESVMWHIKGDLSSVFSKKTLGLGTTCQCTWSRALPRGLTHTDKLYFLSQGLLPSPERQRLKSIKTPIQRVLSDGPESWGPTETGSGTSGHSVVWRSVVLWRHGNRHVSLTFRLVKTQVKTDLHPNSQWLKPTLMISAGDQS